MLSVQHKVVSLSSEIDCDTSSEEDEGEYVSVLSQKPRQQTRHVLRGKGDNTHFPSAFSEERHRILAITDCAADYGEVMEYKRRLASIAFINTLE